MNAPAKKKAKTPKPKPTKDLALARSHYWVAAAIFQGERLLALIAFQNTFELNPSKWNDEQRRAWDAANDLGGGHLVEVAEGYFFVYALRHARNWLGYARQFDGKLAKAVGAFEKVTPHAQDIRDMIEHEDAYLTGSGQKPDEYNSSYNGLPATAHGIVIHGNAYKIGGGKIDVQQTLAALRTILPIVEATRMRLAPPQPPQFSLTVRSV